MKLFFFFLFFFKYPKDETEEETWVLVPHVVLMWLLMCLLVKCLVIPREGLAVINTVKITLLYIFCHKRAFIDLKFLPAPIDPVPPHPRQLEYPVTDVFLPAVGCVFNSNKKVAFLGTLDEIPNIASGLLIQRTDTLCVRHE